MDNTSIPYFFTCILFAFLFQACKQTSAVSLEQEKEKILKLHHAQRAYHFNKDSIAFADQLSNNFLSVNRGIISKPSREENITRYGAYFSSVEFEKWDDVSEPIIRFSTDGSLAYSVVDKIVVLTYEGDDGQRLEDQTHFAWTTIYRKYGDEWKIDCVTSTNKVVK